MVQDLTKMVLDGDEDVEKEIEEVYRLGKYVGSTRSMTIKFKS